MEKDKVAETITEVKENVAEVKEVAEKAKETVTKVIETTKGKTWWNRIWSAIVGAVLAVLSMFGITNDKVAEQKEMVKQVQAYASEALVDIKAGNLSAAAEKLDKANAIGKEVKEEVKEVVENVKNADKEAVKDAAIKGAVEGLNKETTTTDKK